MFGHATRRLQSFRASSSWTYLVDRDYTKEELSAVDKLISRLKSLELYYHTHHEQPLVWQVENVPESENFTSEPSHRTLLCGTMMGHKVFKHRMIYSNYGLNTDLPHDHTGTSSRTSSALKTIKYSQAGRYD